jgi:hypothetical protein
VSEEIVFLVTHLNAVVTLEVLPVFRTGGDYRSRRITPNGLVRLDIRHDVVKLGLGLPLLVRILGFTRPLYVIEIILELVVD